GVQQGVLRGQGDDGGELDAGVAHRLVEVRGLSVDADTDAFEPGPSDPDRGTAGFDRRGVDAVDDDSGLGRLTGLGAQVDSQADACGSQQSQRPCQGRDIL